MGSFFGNPLFKAPLIFMASLAGSPSSVARLHQETFHESSRLIVKNVFISTCGTDATDLPFLLLLAGYKFVLKILANEESIFFFCSLIFVQVKLMAKASLSMC